MKPQEFKNKLKNKIWRHIKDIFYDQRVTDSALVQNINLTSSRKQKKAVISYVTYSHFADWQNNNIGRTQPFEVLSIVKILAQFDYAIDIVGYHDLKALNYLKLKKYDLILGFGEAFYQLTLLHPQAISILYMTEHHPDFTRIEEQKRLDYFFERKNKKANAVRTGNFYWDHHMKKKYSYVMTMSEIAPFLEEYSKPINFFPTGIKNPSFEFKSKDCTTIKRNFLWFGSYGAIHKGLDLLFDIFENRDDIVLHVCGFYEDDRKLLGFPEKDNIIDHGYIDIKSDKFVRLVEQCLFCILPSCSEGFSTAITTTMLHGLIPVVMKDTGFNRLKENAIFLDDFQVGYLSQQLTEISNLDHDHLARLSKKAYDFAQENFSISAFENRFEAILNKIHTGHGSV